MAGKNKKKKKKTPSSDGGKDLTQPSNGSNGVDNKNDVDIPRQEKQRGNIEFKKNDHLKAVQHYTKAIYSSNISPQPANNQLLVSLYGNRAITHMHLKDYKKAVEDCQLALILDPKYIKAHLCHAFGNFYLQNYEQTFADLEAVSKLQPTNHSLQQSLIAAREMISQQRLKDESNRTKKNTETDWIGDFGLLTIDEDDYKVIAPAAAAPTQPITTTTTKRDNDMPVLVPVGEGLTNLCCSTSTIELPKKDAEEKALREKELGNRAFSEGNYSQALVHYSRAIRLNWREAVFFSNRALVYLKMNRFYESISDCTASIDRKPSIKAYARRAAAWASLNEHFLAAEDYKRALTFEPRNTDCLSELQKCLKKLEGEYQNKLQVEPKNEKLKKSLNNVREDLKKIAQKLDSVLQQRVIPTNK